MKVKDLLSRADSLDLQEQLGKPILKLLQLLDPSLTQPSRLRKLLLELRPPSSQLREPESRRHLIGMLKDSEAADLLRKLGRSAKGNVYEMLGSLNFRKNSAEEKLLYQYFEEAIPEPEQLEMVPEKETVSPRYALFPHQRTAVTKVKSFLSAKEQRRVLLHMPTGAGKTRTAMNVIVDHLRVQEPGLVLWLAYSEELCAQAAEEFSKAWQCLGNRDVSVFRNWGNYDFQLADNRDGFLVAGLSKMFSQAMKSSQFLARLADRTTLVVIDEAHQAVAETYRFVLDFVVNKKDSALLGLSATPGRTWNDVDEDERLSKFFFKQKVTLQAEGFANPVDFLIADGYLARPNFVPLYYSGGVDLSGRDLQELEASLDIPLSILSRLADHEQRNLKIIEQTETLLRLHQRILVFATTVQHAEQLACILRARGHCADAITGGTRRDDRRRLIQRYCSNHEEPMVLCNYGVLTAGFDAPRTSATVIARPTKSLVLYSQMIGRAIRGVKAGGNASADIVTVVDQALPGFRDPGEAFANWEDVWN